VAGLVPQKGLRLSQAQLAGFRLPLTPSSCVDSHARRSLYRSRRCLGCLQQAPPVQQAPSVEKHDCFECKQPPDRAKYFGLSSGPSLGALNNIRAWLSERELLTKRSHRAIQLRAREA
jgi:hypothetical protein